MTNPLEDEVYGDKRVDDDNAALNGNPGKPQSDYQFADAEPGTDPSAFEGARGTGTVVPGTVVPMDPEDEPR